MTFPDFIKLREDFPMLKKKMHKKPLVYLDTAATSQKPQVVINTIRSFYEKHYGTVHRAVYQLAVHATEEYNNVRQKVKSFLNASKAEEIIFTRGTTNAINLVAASFGKAFISAGDEVIISSIEHHSNIVPWQMMCEERGAILKVIPANKRGELLLEQYEGLLTSKTKIVSIAHVANSLGTLNPVKKMISMARKVEAKVFIDGAQAASHFPVDVQDLDADFYAFSGHKAYGPTGIGVLYGKEALLEAMPPYEGGGDMINRVTFAKTTYADLPVKFEAGTPSIADVLGLGAALDYLTAIGLKHCAQWEHRLLLQATKALEEIEGLRIVGTAAEKLGIVSFIVEGIHHLDIGTLLDLKGVAIRTGHQCAQPVMDALNIRGTCRLSLGLYNTPNDIDRFVIALQEVLSDLRR